jgi:hypothetical protein
MALLLAAQAVPQSLLAAADEANGAYVQCLFATSRTANGAHLALEQFERKLAASCLREEDDLVRTGTAVLTRRGERNAASRARQEAKDARRSVLDTYRQNLKLSR